MVVTFLLLCLFVFVQSIYGVGLLVFGTPTLLLMGHEFDDTLGLLLPSSLAISVHQIISSSSVKIDETKLIPAAILGIPIGLFLTTNWMDKNDFSFQVGSIMLGAALLRTHGGARHIMMAGLKRARIPFHFFNGMFHGMTNLGGAFLPIYSNSVYLEKIRAVRCTALFYVIYAFAQIMTMIVLGITSVFLNGLALLPILMLFYLLASRFGFKLIQDQTFNSMATLVMWLMAAVFLYRATI